MLDKFLVALDLQLTNPKRQEISREHAANSTGTALYIPISVRRRFLVPQIHPWSGQDEVLCPDFGAPLLRKCDILSETPTRQPLCPTLASAPATRGATRPTP